MKKSSLLINEPPLQVLPSLAKAIGLNEAIVTQQIHYWLENPKAGVEREGFKWIFNTYDEWHENFPFWSVSTIQRVFISLEGKGVVISAQLDAKSRDMRKYYRLDYEYLDTLQDINLTSSNTSHWHDVKGNTETTTESKASNLLETQELLSKASPEWALLAGVAFDDKAVILAQIEQEAINAFESAFALQRPWEWYPDSPADKKRTWEDFRAYIVKLYQQDKDCFGKYVTWSRQPYVKGAMTALGIKRNPQDFPDSWAGYLAQSVMYKREEEYTRLL